MVEELMEHALLNCHWEEHPAGDQQHLPRLPHLPTHLNGCNKRLPHLWSYVLIVVVYPSW